MWQRKFGWSRDRSFGAVLPAPRQEAGGGSECPQRREQRRLLFLKRGVLVLGLAKPLKNFESSLRASVFLDGETGKKGKKHGELEEGGLESK